MVLVAEGPNSHLSLPNRLTLSLFTLLHLFNNVGHHHLKNVSVGGMAGVGSDATCHSFSYAYVCYLSGFQQSLVFFKSPYGSNNFPTFGMHASAPFSSLCQQILNLRGPEPKSCLNLRILCFQLSPHVLTSSLFVPCSVA